MYHILLSRSYIILDRITYILRILLVGNILILTVCNLFRSYISVYTVGIRFRQQQQQQQVSLSTFVSDNTTTSRTYIQQQQQQQQQQQHTLSHNEPYPKWDSHIPILSIYDAIRVSLSGKLRYNQAHEVYIINEQYEMLHSSVPRPSPSDMIPYHRGRVMETLAVQVLDYIKEQQQHHTNSITGSPMEYPYLNSIIRYGGGIAYIVNYADSSLCSDNKKKSLYIDDQNNALLSSSSSFNNDLVVSAVPIFTLLAPVSCSHTFPLPTYETIALIDFDWIQWIPYYHMIYPKSKQYRKAVWRGTATGHKVPYLNQRVQLRYYTNQRSDIFDVKITKSRNWDISHHNISWMSSTNGSFNESYIFGDKISMIDFQKYRAIIDVDGNSWSSRFGKLLCYNSVIIKVQPNNVDYFYPQVQPWKHYIPVQYDLSNLYEMTVYALSDDPYIDEIIYNANLYCRKHFNRQSLIHDTAYIWDRYAYHILVKAINTTPNIDLDVDRYRTVFSNSSSSLSSLDLQQQQQYIDTLSIEYSTHWYPIYESLLNDYNFTKVVPKDIKYSTMVRTIIWHRGICMEWMIYDIIIIIIILIYQILYKRIF